MAQLVEHIPAQVSNSDIPISDIVGAIVRGPIYFSNQPAMPKAPIKSSTADAVIRLPWICQI